LATGGRVCVIGVSAGAKAELNLLALMGKRARIHGSTLRARPLEEKAVAARALEREVLPLFEADAGWPPAGGAHTTSMSEQRTGASGPEARQGEPAATAGAIEAARGARARPAPGAGRPALTVPVAAAFPLEQAAAAYDRFAEGGKLGKIVLTM
jgi:NADPH:quinone reductase-like Zn-dependent oxidoreductase